MPYMLIVSAVKLGDPVLVDVLMIAGDFLFHDTYRLCGTGLSRLSQCIHFEV